ncbi:DUF1573 domain-containing protein [Coraliomargarita parva]|uniref:DUF1573 domain-containing protein n=1 Tax=Coraliomargarita parva TaxID=3014050 RepID=UPI0022B44940|nr:DUF1573 domain-containing protein [Coraliomargarita parva]
MISRYPFALSLSLLLGLCLGIHNASAQAELRWNQTEARIEMAPDQEQVRAEFVVTNDGDDTLRIARIKTSCGCTGSIVEGKIIKPGESTTIVATFNKGKRRGKNHTKLEVYLDNTPDAVATLHMIINIPVLIDAQPAIVYWTKDSPETPRSSRILLDTKYIDTISAIEYNKDLLEVTEAMDPSGKAARILKVIPKSFTDPMRESITIRGSGPDGRSAEAKIHAFVNR